VDPTTPAFDIVVTQDKRHALVQQWPRLEDKSPPASKNLIWHCVRRGVPADCNAVPSSGGGIATISSLSLPWTISDILLGENGVAFLAALGGCDSRGDRRGPNSYKDEKSRTEAGWT
jgi:hypothetical protein